MSSCSKRLWLIYPRAPPTTLPTIPWERRGQPPEDIKAAGGAAESVLICLQFMACNALNRESDPYWKLQYLLFCYNYIYNASAM